MKQIVIIGNGIAGITAARHIRKRSNFHITVISSETEYFYSRTALMYIYMGHMKFEHTKPYEDKFWKKNKISLCYDHVVSIDCSQRTVLLQSGKTHSFEKLIIATGSKPNQLSIPGSALRGVQSLYSFQDLTSMQRHTTGISHAVVIGGGLIGIEMAEMLRSKNIDVTFIIREKNFWNNVLPDEEAAMITDHIRSHRVNVLVSTEVTSIQGNADGYVSSVTTHDGTNIPCQFVGIAVGVSPNIDAVKGSDIKYNRGILVNEYLETNIPGVFAIGDCVERSYLLAGRLPIEQVWYTGRMMGEVVAQSICTRPTRYEPGPWFNSAKFFDIEFQNYGIVRSKRADHERDFYWEHPSRTKSLHVIWNKTNATFIGINAFGIRLRHELFDQWLRENSSVHDVIHNLADANFDPEFFKRHEIEIMKKFNERYHEQLQA